MKRPLTFWATISAAMLGGVIFARAVNHPYCNPPVITTSPASQTVCQGQPAVLTVVASGDAPLTYQWQKYNGSTWVPLNDGGTLSGAATHTLTISSVGSTDAGSYHVYIVNSCDTNTSATVTLALSGTPPAISGLPNTTLNFVRGSSPALITDGTASFTGAVTAGGTLKVSLSDDYLVPGDQLTIRNQGTSTGQIGVNAQNITYEGAALGTFTGGTAASGTVPQPLVVTFTVAPGSLAVNALLNNLLYSFPTSECLLADKPRSLALFIATGSGQCWSPGATRPLVVSCPAAVNVMLVLDKSSSMGSPSTRYINSRNAAESFVNLLHLEASTSPDQAGLVTFCQTAQCNQTLTSGTSGKQALVTYIRNIGPNSDSGTDINLCSGTAIGSGVLLAHNNLPTSSNPRVMVVLTDGEENQGSDPVGKASAAKADGIRVITIGVELPAPPDNTARNTLQSMASSSTDFYEATDSATLGAIYTNIAASLCRGDQPPYVKFHRTAPLNYVDGDSATLLDPNFELLDPDSSNLNGGYLTVSLTAGAEAQDRLEISNQGTGTGQIGVSGTTVSYQSQTIGTINGSGGQGTTPLTVTFTTANATAAAAQALMRAVTYRSLSDSPSTTSRTVQVVANDGANSQSCNSGTSLPTTMTINDAQINDAPVIQFVDTTLSYTAGDAATILAPSGTVTDADSANYDTGKLTVDFSANGQSQDQLSISAEAAGVGHITLSDKTVSYGGTPIGTITTGPGTTKLVVTFNSTIATRDAVQALFRRITYWNSSANPSTLTRTVRAGISDGDGAVSAATTMTVTISGCPGIITPPANQTVTYGQSATLSVAVGGCST